MTHDPERRHRRSIRLKGYDYAQAGAYFVTVCTQDRVCLFGNVVDGKMRLNAVGQMVQAAWGDLPNHYPHVELDEFVIMPNHVHGIIFIVGAGFKPAPTIPIKCHGLAEIVRAFKTFSARRINQHLGMSGVPVWQRNYYEHIIRDESSLNRIRQYILDNPLRWTLDRENPDVVRAGNAGARHAVPPPKDESWCI